MKQVAVSAGARFRGQVDHIYCDAHSERCQRGVDNTRGAPRQARALEKVNGLMVTVQDNVMPWEMVAMREGCASVDIPIAY